jgi:hypothetical protein
MLANTCQEEYEATEEARKVGAGARGGGGLTSPVQPPLVGPCAFLAPQRQTCDCSRGGAAAAPLPALAQQLKSLSGDERDDAERRAKQRLLGNIRLIAELFNKAQVNDRIMLLILADLLGGADNDPPEDSVEVGQGEGGCALCWGWWLHVCGGASSGMTWT